MRLYDAFMPVHGYDIAEFLRKNLPPRPPPLSPAEAVERVIAGCSCGNPMVSRDTPCPDCGAIPIPTRTHPEQCPRCGAAGVVAIEVARDPVLGEVTFVAHCHGATGTATLQWSATLDPARMAECAADAIAALAGGPMPS